MRPNTTFATNAQLLRAYCDDHAHDAFAALVDRHIHLVHAAALRRTRDSHVADDVTQAVFLVLARRAGSVNGTMLTGWLLTTTRYAALNATKLAARRRFHERKAAAMSGTSDDSPAASLSNLAATLDQALARLNLKDRSAIALRFLQGKCVNDVALELDVSPEAAQKRIVRAIDKLRHVLARLGVCSPADALGDELSSRARHLAPSALAPLIAGQIVRGTFQATAPAAIAKAMMKEVMMRQLKFCATGIAAGLLVVGGSVALVNNGNSAAHAATPLAATAPAVPAPLAAPNAPASKPADSILHIPNSTFIVNTNPAEFIAGVDPDTQHTGAPAMQLSSTTKRWGDAGIVLRGIDEHPFRGKRIRYSAWVKSKDLANWAGLLIMVVGPDQTVLAGDDMGDRALTKSNDWTRLESVVDVPPESLVIDVGMIQRGSGQLWLDDATVEVVDKNIPTTDDQNWHGWSYSRTHYTTTMDATMQRNGRPTRLLASTVAGAGEWFGWDHNDRHPDQYRGHTVKMTAWIKTENVTGGSGFTLRVMKGSYQDIVPDPGKLLRTIRGTNDWKKYEISIDVPEETADLCSGIRLGGRGKLWFDDIQYEIVK